MVADTPHPLVGVRSGQRKDRKGYAAKLEERKKEKGMRLRAEIFEASPGSELPARTLLATASFLNFLHRVAPKGFCHLRSGWGAVGESGAMEQWRSGVRRATAQAVVTEQLRSDAL